jgi:prepilin-type N-terminal cleavage/methylation domain-containing protein
MKRNQEGFTLMELMVVIVIVAILAAVAVPLYINYVRDAQRTEARGAIGAAITAEQTFYQLHQTYATTTFTPRPGPNDQLDTDPTLGGLNCDLTEALANWDISVVGTATTYVVTAVPKAGRPPAQGGAGTVTYSYDRQSPTGGTGWNP